MVIDFINYTLYDPGAEASILFQLHESGFRVPRFFCVSEEYIPEEIDAYFATHFQDVLKFHVRLTATVYTGKQKKSGRLPIADMHLPAFANVRKSVLYRSIEHLLEERETYRKQIVMKESVPPESICFHILIQECMDFKEYGVMMSSNVDGILNQTWVDMGRGLDAELQWQETPKMRFCYHDTDHILAYSVPQDVREPDDFFLQQMEQTIRIVKTKFDAPLQVSFFVEPEAGYFYALEVRQTEEEVSEGVSFDSRSVLSTLYSTTMTPLRCSYMKDMYNRIIHDFFKTTLHLFERPYPETNITDDIITCINGRMYFCVSHWKRFTRYFPTFQKNQDAKNVYAVLHDENGARAWAMQRYVNIVCRRLVRSDFKTVQQKLDLMRQRLRQFQLIHLSELTLSELQDYYQMFHNTMIACWHYTLICVLNSRSAIQKLKKASKRYRKKIESDMPYQYAAGIYSIPPKMQKRLQKPLLLAKKAETYRKLFLKVHDQLSTLLLDLFAVIGQRLAEECVISSPGDVQYLTLQEALASIKDPSIHWDAEKIEERKMKYQCYCRMPNYTELVMQEEIKGQQLEMWTHMIFPSGNGKTQGRPCMPGLVKGEVLVLSQPTRLTKSQAAGKILVVRKMSPNCFRLPLLGLIVEEEQNYDAVSDAMHHNILFPVVTGVRGACALLRHTNTVSLNGWTGEIVATREKNDTSVQNKWTQYRKESS